ncbi:MAG: hypothetical protein BWY50_02066 [Spirochaetes bacterium ADurb.Bin315]|nr:MAG: hypothetical protein BWY50_02066 [Spirochaetes bacterium ADurb.Bin315]
MREKGEEGGSECHDDQGDGDAHPDCFHDPLRSLSSIVVSDDRYHSTVQAEDRHEDEGLEPEIDSINRYRIGTEGDEDLVEAGGQYGADPLHDDRRDSYEVDVPHDPLIEFQILFGDCYFFVSPHVVNGKERRNMLAGHGGDRCSQNTETGKPQEPENENRIQDDVGDRPGELDEHRTDRVACRLQDTFVVDFNEDSQ